jgi:peptidoglycan-associated lipoprotein
MTDPRGTEEYNLALGERRAQAVTRYLSALGVESSLKARSVGEEMAAGDEDQGWARDRRAELNGE